MLIRAKLVLRHEALIAAREKAELSQKEAAELAGISIIFYGQLERMDFTHPNVEAHAHAVALALDIPPEIVLPNEWNGTKSEHTHVKTIESHRPLLPSTVERLGLPSPSDFATSAEMKEKVYEVLQALDPRERSVLEMRYGLGGDGKMYTLEETGKAHGVTRERLRQIEARAIRNMYRTGSKKLEPFIDVS